jgi:transposase-like protein
MKQPKYSDEFRADAIRGVRERGFAQIARGLGVRETVLRR